MSKEKKGRKIGRNKNRGQAKAYAQGMRLQINRKKRWLRVLRHQPDNKQLAKRFEEVVGTGLLEGNTPTAKARRKQLRPRIKVRKIIAKVLDKHRGAFE